MERMDDFNPTEELTNLKEKLHATRAKFDLWNDDTISEVKEWFNDFNDNIKKYETHIKELETNLTTMKQRNEQNQEAASDSLKTLESAQRYLKSIQEGIKVTEAKKSDVESELKNEEAKLEAEKEALQATEEALKQRTTDMNKSSILTRDILGLSFQKAPGKKMQVVFRQVDPKNPEDPFVLCVAINSGKYEISDCEPAIPDLEQLVAKLNETNNFRAFLITVREHFQKTL